MVGAIVVAVGEEVVEVDLVAVVGVGCGWQQQRPEQLSDRHVQ